MLNQAQDQVVQRDTSAIAVRDYGGRGSPVVLLHGGTRNLGDWTIIGPALAAHHRVIALDFRSHGASTPCEAAWTITDAVTDVQAVITALRLDPPWLVGHSIGGIVATHYTAEARPCRGVVNIDGVGVSLPPVLPSPDPVGAREQLQTMITQMAEAVNLAAATPPILLSAAEVTQRLATVRAQTIHRGDSWAVLGPTAARSWFQRADGQYQDNPSSVAIAALSQAVLDIDIFALTRQVTCPLLFVEAIDPSTPLTDSTGAVDLMQVWRGGVHLAFEQIAHEHPNVVWQGMVGDHMLVPHQAALLIEVLLHFIHEDPPVKGS